MDTKLLKNRRTRRTTLTLEADVADYLAKRLARDEMLKEKTLVNDLIRKGIGVDESGKKLRPLKVSRFETQRVKGVTERDLEFLLDEV
jgi:hypothetical protein